MVEREFHSIQNLPKNLAVLFNDKSRCSTLVVKLQDIFGRKSAWELWVLLVRVWMSDAA